MAQAASGSPGVAMGVPTLCSEKLLAPVLFYKNDYFTAKLQRT